MLGQSVQVVADGNAGGGPVTDKVRPDQVRARAISRVAHTLSGIV